MTRHKIMTVRLLTALVLVLAIGACGKLPRPFEGAGREGDPQLLVMPKPSRLTSPGTCPKGRRAIWPVPWFVRFGPMILPPIPKTRRLAPMFCIPTLLHGLMMRIRRMWM